MPPAGTAEPKEDDDEAPSKKPSKKKPTKLNPNMNFQAPGTLEELEGQEEGGKSSGMSKMGKIALGGAAVALGAGAVGAGVVYKKKKDEKKAQEEAAAAVEAAGKVEDEPEDELVFDVPADHETKPGSIDLYPEIIYGAESPVMDDSIDAACEEIKAACKGWGTDEDRLIAALGSKAPTERVKIYHRYKELNPRKGDLQAVMKKEEKGDFGFALQCLSLPPDLLDVFLVRQSTRMAGTREDHLFPLVCGRSNADIDHLKKMYFKIHDKDLGQLVESELTGDFERLALSCLQGGEEEFDVEVHTDDRAKEDAEKFHDAGQGKVFGSDEKGLFRILCFSPPAHLKAVNLAYAEKFGYTLFKALEKELHGITQRAAKFTLGMKLKPYETVAKLIKDSCKGIGTDETQLTSCLLRYQIIMPDVDAAYQELYGKSVRDAVSKEEGGNLGKLYMQILQ